MLHRNESPDDWLTAAEAALILSKNSRKQIKPNYMNQLIRQGRIKPYKFTSSLNLFRRGDVEKIVIGKPGRRSNPVRQKEKDNASDAA